MIILIFSLFFGVILIGSLTLAAACILSGQVYEEAEALPAMATLESLRSIAEVELPRRNHRRQSAPVHAATYR
jgi:hypothetical protein